MINLPYFQDELLSKKKKEKKKKLSSRPAEELRFIGQDRTDRYIYAIISTGLPDLCYFLMFIYCRVHDRPHWQDILPLKLSIWLYLSVKNLPQTVQVGWKAIMNHVKRWSVLRPGPGLRPGASFVTVAYASLIPHFVRTPHLTQMLERMSTLPLTHAVRTFWRRESGDANVRCWFMIHFIINIETNSVICVHATY